MIITFLAGCDNASVPSDSQAVSWISTTIEQLDESAAEQLARALEARNEMEATLKSNLLTSIKADGPMGAVGVCSTIAPAIAKGAQRQARLDDWADIIQAAKSNKCSAGVDGVGC